MRRTLMLQLLMMLVTMPPGQGLVQGHRHDVIWPITQDNFFLNQTAREVRTRHKLSLRLLMLLSHLSAIPLFLNKLEARSHAALSSSTLHFMFVAHPIFPVGHVASRVIRAVACVFERCTDL